MSDDIAIDTRLNYLEAALSQFFTKVNLGERSNDQSVPYWIAWKILPALLRSDAGMQLIQSQIVSTVQLVTQAKLLKSGNEESLSQFFNDVLDDCKRPPNTVVEV